MDKNLVLPCISCGYQPKHVFNEETESNQPHEATCFMTQGHYGSTFFDPMDGSYLEINVCDECLKDLAAHGRVLHYTIPWDEKPKFYNGDNHE